MDQIRKFLRLLDARQRAVVLDCIRKIVVLDLDDLDVKKLKGHSDLYRVRKRKIRIVFRKEKKRGVLINVRYRDKAYKA